MIKNSIQQIKDPNLSIFSNPELVATPPECSHFSLSPFKHLIVAVSEKCLKLYGTFFMFGSVLAILLPICYFILPETKDISLGEYKDALL